MGIPKTSTERLHHDRLRTRLVETIYSTVADPDAWQIFLRDLVAGTESRSARLLVMNSQATRVFSSLKLNIDDSYHSQYVEHYVNTCPWRPELQQKAPGRLYSTYLHFSCRQPDYLRSEFFNDWARAQDIYHGVCGTIYQDSGRTVQLLVQRTQRRGHYTEKDTAFINDLVPHLQHSFLLAGQVADRCARAKAITVAAEGELLPFLLLDFSLRPIYCNSGAEGLIGPDTPLRLVNGQLRLADQALNQSLQRVLRDCLAGAESRTFHSAGGMVQVPRSQGTSLQLLVRPIHPDVPVFAGKLTGYVAVYVYDPDAGVAVDQERLRTLYGLSEAEIRVAVALLATPDPAEVAKRCCISLHTVRSHLKAIFAKTDTQSQADLVKRLLGGPARRR
jgi:DNA-binding CsgD family transcriptional regulator